MIAARLKACPSCKADHRISVLLSGGCLDGLWVSVFNQRCSLASRVKPSLVYCVSMCLQGPCDCSAWFSLQTSIPLYFLHTCLCQPPLPRNQQPCSTTPVQRPKEETRTGPCHRQDASRTCPSINAHLDVFPITWHFYRGITGHKACKKVMVQRGTWMCNWHPLICIHQFILGLPAFNSAPCLCQWRLRGFSAGVEHRGFTTRIPLLCYVVQCRFIHSWLEQTESADRRGQ